MKNRSAQHYVNSWCLGALVVTSSLLPLRLCERRCDPFTTKDTKDTKETKTQSTLHAVCNQHYVSNDQRRTSSTSFKCRVSSITSRPTSLLSPAPSCPVHEASRLVADYPERPAAKEHKERKDRNTRNTRTLNQHFMPSAINIACRMTNVERPMSNVPSCPSCPS